MLVAPQALKSVVPVEDSFANKDMRAFSRIGAHQSQARSQVGAMGASAPIAPLQFRKLH